MPGATKKQLFCVLFMLSVFTCAGALARVNPPSFDFTGGTQGWDLLEGEEGNAALELLVDDTIVSRGYHSLGIEVEFPGDAGVYTYISSSETSIYDRIEFDFFLPDDAPDDVSCLLFIQDGEWLWYQTREYSLSPGEWRTISASIAPESMEWAGRGHSQPWGPLSRSNINVVGVKIRSTEDYAGRLNLDNVAFTRTMFPNYEVSPSELSVGDKLEFSFNLPSTYRNPFDPEEISVDGHFTGPSGDEMVVPGFFYQDYERYLVSDDEGRRLEALDPKGAPGWKIRFTPLEAGMHTYEISITDAGGTRTTQPGEFDVQAGDSLGFVRTCPDGGKGFVLDNGDYFFPIGFNYRSPYDVRYESNILRERLTDPTQDCASSNVALDDGTFGYEENMEEMAGHGMNFMETWMAPWWLAIEWSPQRIGFRGAGRYNLRNAWKLDRVMDAAAAHDIYVQLVLINHGQLSSFVDAEWQDHPYNVENGGFLQSPEEVFSDERARRLTKNMLRYIIARWGYSPYIFSWNLLNEMNLVGDNNRFWRSDEITEWFEEMTLYLKETDPWDHMVTGHFTGNFDSDIFRIEGVDYSANNAYYNVNNQDLVSRLRGTYNFHRRFDKPFLVAEYGGTSGGGTVRNLKRDLQVGLWAGYTMPIAASPLFWWNQLVRDQNWYHIYESMVRFERIVGEDRRNMDIFGGWKLKLEEGVGEDRGDHGAAGQMMHCGEAGAYIGWFYNKQYVGNLRDELELGEITDLTLDISDIEAETEYKMILWDTQSGEAYSELKTVLRPGEGISLPDFNKDIAVYLKEVPGAD